MEAPPLAEFKGAYSSSRPLEEAKKIRRLLETLDILDFSVVASETFGKLSAELTRNTKHFSKIPGLALETY